MSTTARNVDVAEQSAAPDVALTQQVDGFKKKHETVLGEEIGYSAKGIKADSREMGKWVAGALRKNLGVDAVVLNKKGLRQDLPAGKITKGTIYSVMPFENSVLTLKLKGADLRTILANPNLLCDGPVAPIDPAKIYDVATLDYLYFGGDGLALEKLDPNPGETGRVWQTPVIEWTKKQASGAAKPLEKVLP